MELVFQSNPLHFLRCPAREVRLQEETAEIIVPDSYPDIAAIAGSSAVAILRGKDCREGSVTVAGGVKGVVLYTPEDGTHPRELDAYIPFSVKVDSPALTARSEILCFVQVRSADARMINSRKALLRVDLLCEITAYEPTVEELCTLKERPACLETREAVYTTAVPMETGERSFAVNDTVEIPMGRPNIIKVYGFHCSPELTDEKLVGNKAVFKGVLRCKVLYLAEDEKLYLHEQETPFSQYCELNRDYDEETVQVRMAVTGYDLEPLISTGDQKLPFTVNLLAQCVVTGQQSVTLIEDAYCTGGLLHPQWKEYELEGSLDQQTAVQTVRHHIQGEMSELLDANVYWDRPEMTRSGDRTQIRVPATVRVLGYDRNGDLQTLTGKTEALQELALSEGAVCHATAIPTGEIYASVDTGGAEIRFSCRLSVQCCSSEKLRTLCGGSAEETQAKTSDRPGLIVRTVEKDTHLWDVAKQYGTTVSHILSANRMEYPVLAEDTMLLVPMT